MKRAIIILAVIGLILFYAYWQNQRNATHITNHYEQVRALNDTANNIATRNPTSGDSLMVALKYVNQAIQLDSVFFPSYENKIAILTKLRARREIINVVNHIIKTNPDNYNRLQKAYIAQGCEYLLLQSEDSANIYFEKAKQLILKRMKTDDNLLLRNDYFMVIILQKDKNEALKEYTTFQDRDKTDDIKAFINQFDKQAFLKEF